MRSTRRTCAPGRRHGAVDLAGIAAAAPQATWHVVELDHCETDMFEAVEASYHYLVGKGISKGRLS